MFDYFHADRAEQFVFFKVPKALFADERFTGLSAESKILYGLMLDRMGLSRKNGFIDEHGRVYIYFTHKDVMKHFRCAKAKASKLVAELDGRGAGLIETRRQGLGRPNIVYVKDFTAFAHDDGPASDRLATKTCMGSSNIGENG